MADGSGVHLHRFFYFFFFQSGDLLSHQICLLTFPPVHFKVYLWKRCFRGKRLIFLSPSLPIFNNKNFIIKRPRELITRGVKDFELSERTTDNHLGVLPCLLN